MTAIPSVAARLPRLGFLGDELLAIAGAVG